MSRPIASQMTKRIHVAAGSVHVAFSESLAFLGPAWSEPVLVGYARPFMETRVFGAVNVAYLFALSQFFVAWIIALLYVRAAGKFDRMAAEVIKDERP